MSDAVGRLLCWVRGHEWRVLRFPPLVMRCRRCGRVR